MLPLGTTAPEFSLPSVSGETVTLADVSNKNGLLVIFMCNHCPFVVHIREELAKFATEYREKGMAIVGINPNDADNYPDDSFDKMKVEASNHNYTFPYLFDETQDVAKAYRAACTPDFFLFDKQMKLVYRGQFDASRPESGIPVTGADLRSACDAVVNDQPVALEQKPSLGCNIKWKTDQAPEYFTGEPAVTP